VELSNLNIKNDLCISIGANINSKFGPPVESIIRCRTNIEETITDWLRGFSKEPNQKILVCNDIFNWSSLYETDPYGVIEKQPNYINTLLIIKSDLLPKPSIKNAKSLLGRLKKLETDYGRNKKEENQKWLSRCLDLDIIWWNNLYINDKELTLPHPRFTNRNFVITPLAELLGKTQKVKKIIHKKWVV